MWFANVFQIPTVVLLMLPCAWCSVSTITLVEACSTSIGISPAKTSPVGRTTAYLTVTSTTTVISTSTPSTTVYPAPTTKTSTSTQFVTSTSTLANTNIATFTSTTTLISNVIITVTFTASTTTTETDTVTSTPTTTVPTSPGFVPASSAPQLKKRAPAPTPARHDLLAARRPSVQEKRSRLEKRSYAGFPQSVTCGVLDEVLSTSTRVSTAATATIHGLTSTITRTSTVTSTIVSTKVSPAASTTTTLSTIVYVTSTVDATVTVPVVASTTDTVSVIAPTATYYAACASNNLLSNDPYDGGNICSAYTQDNTVVSNTDSAYDCCVACITADNCAGALFTVADGTCTIDQSPSGCDPNYVGGVEIAGCGDDTPAQYVAIDGNCGQVEGT